MQEAVELISHMEETTAPVTAYSPSAIPEEEMQNLGYAERGVMEAEKVALKVNPRIKVLTGLERSSAQESACAGARGDGQDTGRTHRREAFEVYTWGAVSIVRVEGFHPTGGTRFNHIRRRRQQSW